MSRAFFEPPDSISDWRLNPDEAALRAVRRCEILQVWRTRHRSFGLAVWMWTKSGGFCCQVPPNPALTG